MGVERTISSVIVSRIRPICKEFELFSPKYMLNSSSINLNETGLYVSTSENVNVTDLINTMDFYLAVFDMYGAQIDFKPLEK